MTVVKIIFICALVVFVGYQLIGLIKQIKSIKEKRNEKNSQESNVTSQSDDNVINCEVLSEQEDSEEEE